MIPRKFTAISVITLLTLFGCSSSDQTPTAQQIAEEPFSTAILEKDSGDFAQIYVHPARNYGILQVGPVRFIVAGMDFSGIYATEISLDPLHGLSKPFDTTGGPKGGQLRMVFDNADNGGIQGYFGSLEFSLNKDAVQINNREVKFTNPRENVWISNRGNVLKIQSLSTGNETGTG